MTDGQDPIRTIPEPEDLPAGSTLLTVRVLAAPLELWSEASQHTAELMREFALLRIGSESGLTRDMSARLLDVVSDLRARYAGVSASQAEQLNAALDAGETSQDFSYTVPPEMVSGCITLLALLDEADEYCADGRELMTQVSTPEQRAFRHWYLGAFIDQVAGAEPIPWPEFRRAQGL